MTHTNIIPGFVKTGICPFKPLSIVPQPQQPQKKKATTLKERVKNRDYTLLFNQIQMKYIVPPKQDTAPETFVPRHGALITTEEKLEEKRVLEKAKQKQQTAIHPSLHSGRPSWHKN